jgi:putative ABC transport system permease protein
MIGVATIVSLFSVTEAMRIDLGDKFDQIGANIIIVPKSDELSLSYGGIAVSGIQSQAKQLDNSVTTRVLKIPNKDNISIVAPKLITGTSIDGKKALVVGVEFVPELSLKSWWNIRTVDKPEGTNPPQTEEQKKNTRPVRKSLPDIKDNQVLLGSKLAEKLKKKPGDEMVILGEKFAVWGVIDPVGSTVDDSIHMDLTKTQSLFKMPNQLSFVEVAALCTNCPIDDIISQIQTEMPETEVTAVREAVKARQDTIDKFTSFAKGVSFIVLGIGSFVAFLTMISSVKERTRELGIFRAVGFRKIHITFILLTEAVIVSLIAGVLGYLVGMLIAQLVGPVIAQMDINIKWDWKLGLLAINVSLLIGFLASIIPARQAAKLDPAEALRFI